MTKTKKTVCPSPAYQPYKANLATRLAQERAARFQPPLISVASTIPADYFVRLERSEVKR